MTARGPLDNWQSRLESHFQELASARSNSDFPVFALEHGLNEADIKAIPQILDHQIRSGIRVTDHWLVWAVYAAESGYRYDGHEYWHSFERGMPRWRANISRDYLRGFFSRFRRRYNGFIPTGRWASHFSNICWPISHAILPKYFQSQFARAMYDARHELARMSEPTPQEVGQVLTRNAWHASKRFQEFLEQPELAGRIVQAMLGWRHKGQSPISDSTLSRIVADLAKMRDAREWLKATQDEVNDGFRGVYKPTRESDSFSGLASAERAPPAASALKVTPALLLRRSDAASWAPVLEIPGFDEVARLSTDLNRFLQTTRCSIAGTDGVMLPSGWTLYGTQRRVLKSWPEDDSVLILFERPHGALDNILKNECRLSPGPVWLFRIGADGLGREVIGKNVRPGQRYVALSRTPLKTTITFAKETSIACNGLVALEIDVPTKIENQEAHELHRIGIGVSRNISIWPAGVCIPNWDGEGHGDWLSTEEPCLGIFHDHPVEEYVLTLNRGAEIHIEGAAAGRTVFVRLPRLQPGRHTISIRPRRVGLPAHSMRELEGKLDLNVRDPRPRQPGTSAHSGLVVTVDPPNPSLAEFWDGSTRVSVLGPEGRDVRCSLSLENSAGATILNEDIARLQLPIEASQWSQRIKRFTDHSKRAWNYLEATKGRFAIHAAELGEFTLRLERSTTPLRWAYRFDQQPRLSLLDDTGDDAPAIVSFYSFKRPAVATSLVPDEAHNYPVESSGGLFAAVKGDHKDVVVVSSGQDTKSLQQLLIQPDLTDVGANAHVLLDLIAIWQGARLAGPLAESRRTKVLSDLLDCLYQIYCGGEWIQLERAYRNELGLEAVDRLKQGVHPHPSYAAALHAGHARFSQSLVSETTWFIEVAKRYGRSSDDAVCRFALEFARTPYALAGIYGDGLPDLLSRARHFQSLMRGARFLALLSISADDKSNLRLPRPR